MAGYRTFPLAHILRQCAWKTFRLCTPYDDECGVSGDKLMNYLTSFPGVGVKFVRRCLVPDVAVQRVRGCVGNDDAFTFDASLCRDTMRVRRTQTRAKEAIGHRIQ